MILVVFYFNEPMAPVFLYREYHTQWSHTTPASFAGCGARLSRQGLSLPKVD